MRDYDELYFEITNIIAANLECNVVQATNAAKEITDLIKDNDKIQTRAENENHQEEACL